jgi:hypothetical protein
MELCEIISGAACVWNRMIVKLSQHLNFYPFIFNHLHSIWSKDIVSIM